MLDTYCWLPSHHNNIHEITIVTEKRPIPVVAQSKAWVCECKLLELRVRIPLGGIDICLSVCLSVCCECCVLSGRGLCVGLITSHEDSCRVWCVLLNVILNPRQLGGLTPLGLLRHGKKSTSREPLLMKVTVTFSHLDGISVKINHIYCFTYQVINHQIR
jgi:hypothetical protein